MEVRDTPQKHWIDDAGDTLNVFIVDPHSLDPGDDLPISLRVTSEDEFEDTKSFWLTVKQARELAQHLNELADNADRINATR